jgi:hypothetical protein
MAFHTGQKVVCIDTTPRKMPRRPKGSPPVHIPNLLLALREGAVYTVRELDERLHMAEDGGTLRLEEIQGPVVQVRTIGPWEIGFAPNRFRPVKTTSIEVFRKMLAPDARADAAR